MTPSHAEVARTLAHGRLPGRLRIGRATEPATLPHATDRSGRPLILASDRTVPGPAGPQVVLSVEDVPPVVDAPSLGCARIGGRLRRLPPAEQRAAVDDFAAANPDPGLLDVGRGASLFAVDVTRVRLDHRGGGHEVDPAEFAAAIPDPLHELERDLLRDLADHHAAQVEGYFRFLLAVAGVGACPSPPRAVRLDRYGFVVATGAPGWVRLNFHRPVHCRHELAQLLHPVLSCHHHRPPA